MRVAALRPAPVLYVASLCAFAGMTGLVVARTPAVALLGSVAAIGSLLILLRPALSVPLLLFLAALYPNLRLLAGGVPVYASDLLIVAGLVAGLLVVRGSPVAVRGDRHRDEIRNRGEGRAGRTAPAWPGPLVLLFGAAIVPSFISLAIDYPAFAREVGFFLARSLLAVGSFFLVARWVRDALTLQRAIACLYYGCLLASLWAIAQAVPFFQPLGVAFTDTVNGWFGLSATYSENFVGGQAFVRAPAGFNVATAFGGFLAVATPLVFFALVGAPERLRPVLPLRLGGPVLGVGLFLTYARHAWIAAAAGFAVGFLLRRRGAAGRALVPLAGAFGFVLLLLFALHPGIADMAGARLLDLADFRRSTNIQARLSRVPEFVEAVQRSPELLFTGQNIRALDLFERGLVSGDKIAALPGFVSNSWLLVALDTGLLAFAVYAAIVLAFFLVLGRAAARAPPDAWLASVAAGCAAALASSALAHLGDNYFAVQIHMRQFQFALLGLGYAIVRLCGTGPGPRLAAALAAAGSAPQQARS